MPPEALHEQRERLRDTLSKMGDAIVTTDAEKRVTFLNSFAESFAAWTQADANGQPLDNLRWDISSLPAVKSKVLPNQHPDLNSSVEIDSPATWRK